MFMSDYGHKRSFSVGIAEFLYEMVYLKFFYYEFYKILDISFHIKILRFPLRKISPVNYRLGHVTECLKIRL